MFLLKVYNYIRGFLTITVEGYFIERFLNICTRRNIYLWNVRRRGTNKMSMNISINGFKKLGTVGYKSKSAVKIVRRRGWPFLIKKYKKRHAFFAGIIVFVAMVILMTSFVWAVEVTGNDTVSKSDIKEALARAGLKTGMPRFQIDVDDIENNIMMERDDLIWVGINIKGTRAKVEVKERRQIPDIIPEDQPCNIVARIDGVIESIDVRSGEKLAKIGDVVSAGEFLVSGALPSDVVGVRYVHARADVFAKTWHEETRKIVYIIEEHNLTGRFQNKNSLEIFGFRINFYINSGNSYSNYDIINSEKQYGFGENYLLPIQMNFETCREIDIVTKELSEEEAYEWTLSEIKKSIEAKLPEGTVVLDIQEMQRDNILTVTYECSENIAQQVEIGGNE